MNDSERLTRLIVAGHTCVSILTYEEAENAGGAGARGGDRARRAR